YCLDAQRHLCYGRVGGTGQAVAIPDETYRVLAGVLARLSGDTLGSFALPYHVSLGDAVRQQVGKVQHALVATTVADDARRQLQAAATSGASGAHVTVGRADALTVRATLRLSAGLAMARGVAEALDRASPKTTSRHLDAVADAKAVKQLAAAVQHSPEELGDVLVLQVGERSRVLPASTLVSREALPDGSQGPERFAGTDVLAKALADLFADRGRVCFAVGHGERRLETTGGGGLSRSAGRLRGRGFRVSELDLARAATIPKDCAALVLAGPTRPLGAAAEKAIAAYVAAGGRVALMLDPPKGVVPLVALLQRHGIAVPKPTEALVDSRGDLEPGLLLLHLARDTGFTASWTRRPAIFLTGCALTVGDAQVEGAEAMAVARSLDPGAQPPPVLIAASRSTRGKGHKLLVFGDVDVFSNRVLSSPLAPGNLPLLLDALTWLAE
ncbi:Gldg family protein, partial [bacterium]|nr:Gldg family protein [bacterium]